MNDDMLREIYAENLSGTEAPGETCPSTDTLAGVAEGTASEAERLDALGHVAACRACQRDLALLMAVADTRQRKVSMPGRAWLALAASVVLLFVGVRAFSGPDADPVLRGAPVAEQVAPKGVVAGTSATSFVWRGVAGATRYEVEVVDGEGRLVGSALVRDTVTQLVSDPPLSQGVEYHWQVTAVRADGTRIASPLLPFSIRED